MSRSDDDLLDPPGDAEYFSGARRPPEEDLPPVEPPSAGFIVQLFLVPALIVTVIVGVYLLFGRLASNEADWRQLITDVRSDNSLVRWKAALSLAQILEADAHRGPAGQRLTANREIALALSELYAENVGIASPSADQIKQQEFLSKALGRLEVDDVVLPVLQEAMQPHHDRDVRKHAVTGIAMIAGRAHARGDRLDSPKLVDQLIDMSQESDPFSRQQAAFTLGMLPTPAARERLAALLDDADEKTRANAAVALARNGSTAGLPVFEAVFDRARQTPLDPSTVRTQEDEAAYFEEKILLANSLKAVGMLASRFTAAERAQLQPVVAGIASSTEDAAIRSDATDAAHALQIHGERGTSVPR